MANSAPVSDFKWGFIPGAFWGFLVGAVAGTFIGLTVTGGLGTDIEAGRAEQRSLQEQCIGGNDRACRVYEVRYGR